MNSLIILLRIREAEVGIVNVPSLIAEAMLWRSRAGLQPADLVILRASTENDCQHMDVYSLRNNLP